MKDYLCEQSYVNFLSLDKGIESLDENSSQLVYSHHENPSLTQLGEDSSIKKPRKIKKKKRVDFHYKRRRRTPKNVELGNTNPFNFEEDQRILSLVLEHGPKFASIAGYFPDRSPNAVKNRYYKFLRYRWDQILGSEYQHMNCRRDPEVVQIGDLTSILEELNLCPEVSSILTKFLDVVQAHFQ